MKLHLYQIWYDENTKPENDSGLLAFDCRNNPEFLKREIAHLIRFYDEIVQDADNDSYFALLSPRFGEKTGLTIEQVKNFVVQNPANDIFLFNPFPMHVYFDMNVWSSGEVQHEGLKELTQFLFQAANIKFDVYTKHRNTIFNTVYCNYWVASKEFLDGFIGFIKHLDLTIDRMPESERAKYFSDARYHTKASFYPFIFERLISTFLLLNHHYKTKPFIFSEDSQLVKKMKRIDRCFYLSTSRTDFDNWEAGVHDIDLSEKKYLLVNNTLRPKVDVFPFVFLNKGLASLIRRINQRRMSRLSDRLNI